MNNEDINFDSFFQITKDIFEGILKDDRWFFNEALQTSAQEAWEELKDDFDKLKSSVTKLKPDDPNLANAGLSRKQLAFKLTTLNFLYKKKYEKKYLGAINVILGSLIRAFPLAEPIKEFKEFLELSKKAN